MIPDERYKHIPFPSPRYVARDGRVFTDRIKYFDYEREITAKQMIWYEKRFSVWGELMYLLFKKEPKGRQY